MVFNLHAILKNVVKSTTSLFKLFIIAGVILFCSEANAVVTITKATGGTTISADKSENAVSPSYTTLGSVVITEGSLTDFSIGSGVTFTLIAPSGWKFNPASTVTAIPGGDITSISVVSVTATLITLQMTISGTSNSDLVTIAGVQVRANEGGNIPTAANIARGGTATISGCASGAILANLSQAAGVINKLVITLPGQGFSDASLFSTSGNSGTPTAQTAGVAFAITKIRACDQFFNVVSNYFGVKSLTFTGPSNGLSAPTYTSSVSFASGVSSTILTTTLKKAEATTISVSDGTYSGPSSSLLSINPGPHTKFLVQASSGGNIGGQITGIPFDIRIIATDANNNTCSSGANTFSGTAEISSLGDMTIGSGTTGAFTAGILTNHTIAIADQGSFSITALNSIGAQTGSSNSFLINYPLATLSGILPTCITQGGSQFVITIYGSDFNSSSVVLFNGVARSTSFVNTGELTAIIPSSDIASPGVYEISVNTPGTGSSAPLVLNMNSSNVANISICQGETYTLPDGIDESTDGTYISVIPSVEGCDSVITTNLTVNPNPTRSQSVSICPGSSYTLPDSSIESTPGFYSSYVSNVVGCDSIIYTTLSFNPTPTILITPTQIDCFGNTGSVSLNVIGGNAPYTYGPESTTNLAEGTYNFTVTDANGCSDMNSVTIDPAPDELVITATPTQIDCFGGTGEITIDVSGGDPSYNMNSTPTLFLTAGTYSYQVTDNNGCTANTSATINAAPSALAATTGVVNTPCGSSTGVASVNVSGGTGPYSFEWDDALGSTTPSITGLGTGVYTVLVTDSRGCTITKTATVVNSNPLQVNVTGVTGICPGGSTTLCATAGFASYSWSTGETTQCITTNVVDTIYLTATDVSGCIGVKSIVTRNSTLPVCSITGGDLCLNSVLVLRAPTGYTSYLWNTNIRTSTLSVRSAGTYTVTIKNADGCASTCSYTVNSPMRTTSTKSDAKCSNEFKGSATVTASAGISPYTYTWNNGMTTSTVTGLPAGSYTARVVDAGGCALTSSILINSNKTTNDYSYVTSNFNANAIAQNSFVWFSAVANITYTGTYPVTIRFTNQNINTTGLNLIPADAKLIITNAVSQASTVFIGGEWVTTAPPNLLGNYFVAGCAFQVPATIAPSLANVKWRGIWTSSSSCLTNIRWKWSAAAYSNLSTVNSNINVQPVDDASASPYGNSDLAGTPENYKQFCTAGARSIGGSDFVGTYTTIVNRVPCSTPDVCNALRSHGLFSDSEKEELNIHAVAYPNPFSAKTTIEFERIDLSGKITIELYSLYGEKLRTLFNENIEAGLRYTVEVDATDLTSGIYFYKMTTETEEVRGKLYLQK